ncbi:hypothetical protein AB833_26325 [Chromatiales bacterium (ex Bugula neritina AB1)]|nr:hypothetical protein AB833_26325 [Chromatiales bacterium (ex Bugula neritina AB1)]
MNNLLVELQTGQVAFLSGLLAGFSLTVAANVLQLDMSRKMPRICFVLLMLSTLLFLIALYIDVRLTIELAGNKQISDAVTARVFQVRQIGTASATLAYVVFVVAVGSLGWLAGIIAGVCSTILAGAALATLIYVWSQVGAIQTLLGG